MTFAMVRFAFVNICQKKIKREKNEKCESVFIHESREKKKVKTFFAISWFHVVLGLDLLVKPVIFFKFVHVRTASIT